MNNLVKIVVFVPISHAQKIREQMGEAGAGKLGNYSHSSFSSKGIGRFKPKIGARPAIGMVGKLEEVDEERIEMICERDKVKKVIRLLKEVHPYEEVALDVYPILTLEEI